VATSDTPADFRLDTKYSETHQLEERDHLVSALCPFCDWVYLPSTTNPLANASGFVSSVKGHIVTHHMKAVLSTSNMACDISTCDWEADRDAMKKEKKPEDWLYNQKRRHTINDHAGEWLAEQKKALRFECTCGNSRCKGKYNEKELASHFKTLCSDIPCPYDGCKSKPVPKGWYRCEYDLWSRIITSQPFGAMPDSRCHTLINAHVAFADGDKVMCPWHPEDCQNGSLMTSREVARHCNGEHKDHVWPLCLASEGSCGKLFSTEADLQSHHIRSHMMVGGSLRFTSLISDALKRAHVNMAKTGDQNRKPVLLCAGFDAFSCNTTRIHHWLQETEFDFMLALINVSLPDLERDYLTTDGSFWLGMYNSLTLLQALNEPEEAPDKYNDLVESW
jgi:hypothetical protein